MGRVFTEGNFVKESVKLGWNFQRGPNSSNKDPKTLYLVSRRGGGTWVSHLSTVHDTVDSIRSLWDIDSVTIIYIRHWFVECLEPLLGTLRRFWTCNVGKCSSHFSGNICP